MKTQTDCREGKADSSAPTDWYWIDPKRLKVHPEFQRLIPVQSRGELLALEQSIKDEGCRDPTQVWKWQNIILDGQARREFCIKYGNS